MAVVAVDGGDELRSVAACEKQRGGRSEESEKGRGGCVASRTGSRATRGRRQAGGGRGIASARHRAASGRGEEDDRGGMPGGLGRTGAGPAGLRGERQVRFLSSLLLFLFNFVFYFL